MSQEICLVAFDTDHVKEYVFATQDLKKIRGGSTLLEHLNQEETLACLKEVYPGLSEEDLVKGGGMALALLPTPDLAQSAIDAVERLYRQEAATGTITGAYVTMPRDDLETEAFASWYRRLGVRLRRTKDQKGLEPALPLLPYLRPCGSCGQHPAQHLDPYDEGQALCVTCYRKLQTYQDEGRHLFRQNFRDYVGADWTGFDFPSDLNVLGALSSPSDYVGFILADGNRVGDYLIQVARQGFRRFRVFSQGLDRVVRESTHAALKNVLAPRRGTAPFEILLVGGDDLMLVSAADAALELAAQIVEGFAERTAQLAQHAGFAGAHPTSALSLSAGVVIAHSGFPINKAHTLASELLRSAKRKSSDFEDGSGMVDFMVVTEAATAGLRVLRSEVLTEQIFAVRAPAGEEFQLTERPYTVERLRQLLHYASEFRRKIPRSGLQGMYEALFTSKVQAQLVALTTIARAKPEARTVWLEFIEEMLEVGASDVFLPWRTSPHEPQRFSTPLGDLVEISPFARRL